MKWVCLGTSESPGPTWIVQINLICPYSNIFFKVCCKCFPGDPGEVVPLPWWNWALSCISKVESGIKSSQVLANLRVELGPLRYQRKLRVELSPLRCQEKSRIELSPLAKGWMMSPCSSMLIPGGWRSPTRWVVDKCGWWSLPLGWLMESHQINCWVVDRWISNCH